MAARGADGDDGAARGAGAGGSEGDVAARGADGGEGDVAARGAGGVVVGGVDDGAARGAVAGEGRSGGGTGSSMRRLSRSLGGVESARGKVVSSNTT